MFLEEDLDTIVMNITGKDDQEKELISAGRQDTQDDHNPQRQIDMTEKVNETLPLIEQSLLPDVENNYVNSMGESSDDFEFLDSNRLDSAIGFLGNGISDVPINDQMNIDQTTRLIPDDTNNEQTQMQGSLLDDASSSRVESIAGHDQKQLNSLVDRDTEELYKDVASLDLATLKESPIYSKKAMDEMQNPDPVMPSEIDEGESDDDEQPETQSLEVALQSGQGDGELINEVMASSVLQADDDHGDPICSISIATHNANTHPSKKDQDHKHEHEKEAGFVSQDRSLIRQEAWDVAHDILKTFGLIENFSKTEQRCEGHKETIFGVSFSECGKFCGTASQDSTVKIWDVQSNKLLTSLEGHCKDFECLRVAWASSSWSTKLLDRTSKFKYLLASSGADGTVRLWACQDPRISLGEEGGWKCYRTLDHSHFAVKSSNVIEDQDKPQIYTLQFIDHWEAFDTAEEYPPNAFIMTSSDDYLHFWALDGLLPSDEPTCPDRLGLKEVTSLHFGSIRQYGYGVSVASVTEADRGSSHTQLDDGNYNDDSPILPFGGERNPNNVVYVFDASFCSANGLVGVALSDGTLRLINGRGICVCILSVPNSQSHLTSCTWDQHGSRLITTVATGQLVSWQLRPKYDQGGSGFTKADHVCTFEGGHQTGRPLFGARYYGGETEELILSWSVDGSLCLWDSKSEGRVKSPVAVLRQFGPSPLYAVEVHPNQSIAVGGAESECCSHGVPLYLYKIEERSTDVAMDDLD